MDRATISLNLNLNHFELCVNGHPFELNVGDALLLLPALELQLSVDSASTAFTITDCGLTSVEWLSDRANLLETGGELDSAIRRSILSFCRHARNNWLAMRLFGGPDALAANFASLLVLELSDFSVEVLSAILENRSLRKTHSSRQSSISRLFRPISSISCTSLTLVC
jgi:hypothetical protein